MRSFQTDSDTISRLTQIDSDGWERLKCRFSCGSPVAGLVHAPGGCLCYSDEVQALCAQHIIKGLDYNENMSVIVMRKK